MLYGVFSDVHSNLAALDAVIASMKTRGAERFVCLGDLVGYGAEPEPCVQKVAALADVCIFGNHDSVALRRESSSHFNQFARFAIEWTQSQISEESQQYLKKLPYIVEEGSYCFVHASPKSPADWNYITSLDEAQEAFEFFTTRYCLVGHTHSPVIVVQDELGQNLRVLDAPAYEAKDGERVLVNVGSVGQPRDRDPRASWCLVDDQLGSFEIVRVSYDIASTQRIMEQNGFPAFLVQRLELGR